jgi:hypothetical protein
MGQMNYDITFCTNPDCKLKKDCQRSLDNLKLNKKEWLSVSHFFPSEDETFCEYLIKKEE